MPAVCKIDAIWARQIADQLEARGRPANLVLRQVGLDRTKIQVPDARIPFAKYVAFLEAAAQHLGDRCFGLHFGSGVDPLDAGVLGYLAVNSPRLEAALRNLVTYLCTLTEGGVATLDIDSQHAVLAVRMVDPTVTHFQQVHESALAMALNVCRFVTSKMLVPEFVEFQHDREDDLNEFERYFRCPVLFGCRRNAIVLDKALLALPCKNADDRLLRILKSHCDKLLASIGQARDLRGEIEHLIASRLTSGIPAAKFVASEMGMSERTLARRLAQLGVSFGQLVDRVRRDLAVRYLSEPRVRPSQVAYLLGYSEPSGFNHAFRRWTGVSPSKFASFGQDQQETYRLEDPFRDATRGKP